MLVFTDSFVFSLWVLGCSVVEMICVVVLMCVSCCGPFGWVFLLVLICCLRPGFGWLVCLNWLGLLVVVICLGSWLLCCMVGFGCGIVVCVVVGRAVFGFGSFVVRCFV